LWHLKNGRNRRDTSTGHRWNAASHGQRLAAPERLDAAKGKEKEKRKHRKLSLGQKMKKLVQGRRSEAENEAAIK
jgi:hypothetical protein